MKTYTSLSLFCGAGGLDMGFERAGFQTIWANDVDKDACITYKDWNEKAEVVCAKIQDIPLEGIPKTDIILGGFPCQGFSLSGPRKLDDSRNKLYQNYVAIVKEKQPMAFVGENVKGLLSMAGGEIFDAILNCFSDCGYQVFYQLLNASDYEVPQDRERVIICGFRNDIANTPFVYPEKCKNKISIKEALSGFSVPEEEEICNAPYSSRYMSRNRRREWERQSFTIPAMAKQVPLHPSSPPMLKIGTDSFVFGEGRTRRFSYKECAAIQTFPENISFYGNLTSKYKQIGNAVPVRLAEHIAEAVYDYLESKHMEK